MRTFTLVNGDSESCSVTEQQLFLHDVDGLGFERKNTYRQVGDRFVRVNSQPQQKSLTGKVALLGADPYQSYFNFVQFIQKEPLVLYYTPNPDGDPATNPAAYTYRRNVDVKKLTKSELEHAGYLNCSIELTYLTPWYRYVAISNGINNDEDLLKWGIEWGIEWGPFDEYSKGIRSNSPISSPSRLTIYGPVTNPTWKHYLNGIVVEEGKVSVSLSSSEYLVVDNIGDPYSIVKRSRSNLSLVTDVYSSSDFTTQRFINIQKGINTLVVEGKDGSNNDIKPLVKLEGHIYYESV